MSIGGKITKTKLNYFFYCKKCKQDHVFEYGRGFQKSQCGLRFVGLESHLSDIDYIKDVAFSPTCCVHIFRVKPNILTGHIESSEFLTDCGFSLNFHYSKDPVAMFLDNIKCCPECGKKIEKLYL